VAAALAALDHHRVGAPAGDLDRVLGRTDGGHHDDAVVLQARDQLRLGLQGEGRDLDPVLDEQLDPLRSVAG
jgi:hypothetical protein